MALFSDWGTSAWAEDVTAAAAQASDWLTRTASARAWSAQFADLGQQVINQAADAQPRDARAFWTHLVNGWALVERDFAVPDGWSKLGATFAQAGSTSYTVAEAREQGSAATVAAGTVKATAEDIADTAAEVKSKGPAVVVGLLVLGVIVYAATR